ncbi:hypothetical protein MKW98_026100 [Papaver atlanticum]|uniref:SAUR family protein n=1 Tax=Papaver atlanticum TaxID=357466 RepID=A0AAD4X4P0_9MAGN|nr:hypothetical protein MKW98_026100 [Papaver atlanticum]
MCGVRDHHHVPRGCVAILVGQKEERFVIPVTYLNHQKFKVLLKEAEEYMGFFLNVQGLIEQEIMPTTCSCRHHNLHQHHNHHHHHHFLSVSCFKALED